MLKRIAFCFLAIILIWICSILPADAFDGNDYGGGGGGGGGGSNYGGYSSSSGGSGFSSHALSGFEILALIVIMLLVFIFVIHSFIKSIKQASKRKSVEMQTDQIMPSSYEGLNIMLPDRTALIESIIKVHDPNFSASDFISFTKRVYIDIQIAWCKRDMTTVRVFLHDNLYDTTVKQVQAKIDRGVVYHYESMVVNTSYLTSYAKDGQFEYLTVYLNARMIDWQEDEKTGKILRGDKITRWDLRYKMKFMRSAGVLTKEATAGTTGHNCPNCGAALEMMSSAKCEYCGSIVMTGQYNWVLSDFGTIRNDTVDEGVRVD